MRLEKNKVGEYVAILRSSSGRGKKRIDLFCTTEAEARQIASEKRLEDIEKLAISDLIDGNILRKMSSKSTTVGRAIEMWHVWACATYESINSTTNMLSYATAFMRDCQVEKHNISSITESDVDRWVNKPDGCKANTRKFRLATLRSLFYYCAEKNLVDVDVSKLVSVKYKDLSHDQKEVRVKRLFTEEEYQAVLAWLREHIKTLGRNSSEESAAFARGYQFWVAATIIGRYSALRLSDVASLQWASITENRLIVHTDKKNTRVDIEITPELRAGLDEIRNNNSKWCFPKQAEIASDPKRRCSLPNYFARILKRAGVANHHYHELRATAITEKHTAGQSMKLIAAFAGHGSESSTAGYITETQPLGNS